MMTLRCARTFGLLSALASAAAAQNMTGGATAGDAARPADPAATTQPAALGPVVDARADELLQKLGAHLRGMGRFSFDAEAQFDVVERDGERIQQTRRSRVDVQRGTGGASAGIRASSKGDGGERDFFYDGKRVAIVTAPTRTYSVIDAPASLDATFDTLAEKYGLTLPTVELLYSDPYATLMESVRTGRYVGMSTVGDAPCHHLAFTQDAVDWQLWVTDGDKPLPRRLVLTYKRELSFPQYQVTYGRWEAAQEFPAGHFSFTPPEGLNEIPLLPVEAAAAGATTAPAR